jgi:hypothetical protein
LLRVWATNADLGSEVARFSRKYFFSGALLAYCIISAYAWAGFPYDNLCFFNPDDEASGVNVNYTRVNVTYTNVTLFNMTVQDNILVERDQVFRRCGQRWRDFQGPPFPPTARVQKEKWMGASQTNLANLYGWTSVVAVAIYILVFFGAAIKDYSTSWIIGAYMSRGQEQHIDFSSDNG